MSFQFHADPGDENQVQLVNLAQLQSGQALRLTTLNSIYELRKQANSTKYRLDQLKLTKGGYILNPNPCLVEVIGANIRVGSPLLVVRSDLKLTRTSIIQHIEELV